MKVTRINITPVSVPFTKPQVWRYGLQLGVTNVIVEIETDDGISGVGEAPGVPSVAVAASAIRDMSQLLLGRDPLDISGFRTRLEASGWEHYPRVGNVAAAAFDMAMWDVLGKQVGLPVWRFLGGCYQPELEFSWPVSSATRSDQEARDDATTGRARGFRSYTLKVGLDLANDLAMLRAVRDAVGSDAAISVDANEGWAPAEAMRALNLISNYGVEFVEEPIATRLVHHRRTLRSLTNVPIANNQSAWLPSEAADALRQEATPVVVTDPHQCGGLLPFMEVASACRLGGATLVKHCFNELGVATLAGLNALSAYRGSMFAHQQLLTVLEDDLVEESLEFRDGALAAPLAPGLGATLDRDAVARYHDVYARGTEFATYGWDYIEHAGR